MNPGRDLPRAAAGVAFAALVMGAAVLASGALRHADTPSIAVGSNGCLYCRMEISDPRFGAAAVTSRGKTEKFDSIECLAGYVAASTTAGGVLRELWVSDFQRPGALIRVERARFLRTAGGQSPMGRGLLAVSSTSALKSARERYGGRELSWLDVLVEARSQLVASPVAGSEKRIEVATPAASAAIGDSIVNVSHAGPVRGLAEAVALVARHGRIIVWPGVYAETTTIRIARPVRIEGMSGAVLDAAGHGTILLVEADSVTVHGLTLRNVGMSFVEDRAAIRVNRAKACRITDNRIDQAFFGIYLAEVEHCEITGNELRAGGTGEATSGNGVHLWSSRSVTITNNYISGHRDGIYFEFVHDADVRDNVSERNLRYGLHFMYSDDSRYLNNVFRENGSGVAVMYTKRVTMRGNRFERNWGAASYGLLLKEISDSRLEHNTFEGNTVALLADGASRLHAAYNRFRSNGWAVKLGANTEDGRFESNRFEQNTFDVATNGRVYTTVFAGNYWDSYRGYDLDRDGVGDVPHHPVRLFSLLVEREEPSLILLRSGFVELLDAAERALPSLTPSALADRTPAMRRPS